MTSFFTSAQRQPVTPVDSEPHPVTLDGLSPIDLERQYLRDLERIPEDDACFFAAMGDVIARRMEGRS